MSEISAYDAKTHLSELLERVQKKGEHFVITKHGRPVAELRPASECTREEKQAIIERMKAFQKKHTLGGITIRELIDARRRY